MATQSHAASVQGAAIRVTRLDASGNLLNGPQDSYTMNAFMHVTFTPEFEAGDELVQKGADGTVCVTFKAPDTLKRLTMEIAICEPDPEFSALVGGGILLTRQTTPGDPSTAQAVGWSVPQVGENTQLNPVAIEVWSYAVANGRRVTNNPYYHWIFPYATLAPSGDRVIENGLLATTFSGLGLGNIEFDVGPDGRWEWPTVTDRPYSYARDAWAPIGYKGWYQWNKTTGVGTPRAVLVDPGSFTNEYGDPNYDATQSFDNVLAAEDD